MRTADQVRLLADPSPATADAPAPAGWLGRSSWALYDWANSPFTTLIITFVFPAYFQLAVVGDGVEGQILWGRAMTLSGLLIVVLAPLSGAVVDAAGPRKPWIMLFTGMCAAASILLWFVYPDPAYIAFALAAVIVANIGFELAIVLNNAMLPEITPESRVGRLSGWAWGLGYIGGLAALIIALILWIEPEIPWLALDRETGEHVRIVGPFVGLWLVVFSLPLFAFTPDRHRTQTSTVKALRQGLHKMRHLVGELRTNKNLALFLVAHMLYADGLGTIFMFGGLYASAVFQMSIAEVLQFGIALNLAAGMGAFAFAWLDDWLGSKPTILLALTGVCIAAIAAASVHNVVWLWVAGCAIGIFVGPVQAASRSMMARISPIERRGEYFGLFTLSGKATVLFGPALVALVTEATGSQRWGIASALVFLIAGFAVLLAVNDRAPRGAR